MQSKKPVELYENFPTNTDTVYFSVKDKLAPPSYPLHWHEYIEITYIIEGTNVAKCENDIVEVKEDDFLIVNSNELHQNIGGKRRYAFLLVHPDFFNKNEIILKRTVRDSYLSELINKMIIEHNKKDEFSRFNIQGYAYLLIAHLYRNHAYKFIDRKAYINYSKKQINVNKCMKFIYDNYNKNISLEYVANMVNVSKYHFCNIFKEFTGQTFKEYQNGIRINKAIELLGTSDMSVTEIAFLCGFNDSNYFTRKFHQITGKTPHVAREELKQKSSKG